jgi:hypothetical protein
MRYYKISPLMTFGFSGLFSISMVMPSVFVSFEGFQRNKALRH